MCIYESRVDAVTCFQSRQDSFPAAYIVGPTRTTPYEWSNEILHGLTLVGALFRVAVDVHSSDSGLRVCALFRAVIDVHVHYKRISVTLVCALLRANSHWCALLFRVVSTI